MLRIGVTGRNGQLAQALIERGAARAMEIVTFARPDCDLLDAARLFRAIETADCDVIVNAAAYTAVDRAELEPDLAMAVNAEGARHVAKIAAAKAIPIIQISTDYVFDGSAARAYLPEDATAPLGAYGRSKRAGEAAVMEACANHVVLRTAWVYSATGQNFVRTMLRLGETRDKVRVVADQFGSPTYAPDLADAILSIAQQLAAKPDAADLRGIFHAAGSGEASWADFAEAIFEGAERRGRAPVNVERIGTRDYPTPAERPQNSRLNALSLHVSYGLVLPDWRQSIEACLDRLLAPQKLAHEELAHEELASNKEGK